MFACHEMPLCKHVFVDVGANIGMHARFLFEPEYYPKSAYARLFRRLLGNEQNETCAIEIEPNPVHADRHRSLQAHYRSKGRSYVYLQHAVAQSVRRERGVAQLLDSRNQAAAEEQRGQRQGRGKCRRLGPSLAVHEGAQYGEDACEDGC